MPSVRAFLPALCTALALTAARVAAQPPAQAAPPPAAPPDWYLRDPATDRVPGAAVRRALRELLAGPAPKREVLVAVIDGGVDTAHAALRAALWRHPGEVPGNGRDDDGDGYVDDVRGWNFLGAADGRNVGFLQFEITRLAAGCRAGAQPGLAVGLSCDSVARAYEAERAGVAQALAGFDGRRARFDGARTLLARRLGVAPDALTRAPVEALAAGDDSVGRARATFIGFLLPADGPGPYAALDAMLRRERDDLDRRLTVGYDLATDPRAAVLGDVRRLGRRYGNGDVTGPPAAHATAVAGIIAGAPSEGVWADSGVAGVAPFVHVLPIRAAMTGDERDEDVANAIRYAVDRGALVINLSFGKAYSPGKAMVDRAVRYAAARGVLLVHAAMNEGSDNDRIPRYPVARYLASPAGDRAATWLEVGATGPAVGPDLAARFSDYGRTTVDLFAPGVSMVVAQPGGGYARGQGTSYAAPVVSGVAALLLAYFPSLTGADVRRILLATVTPYRELMVALPGEGDQRVPFGTLSVSGGVVNAYAAVHMARQEAARRAVPSDERPPAGGSRRGRPHGDDPS